MFKRCIKDIKKAYLLSNYNLGWREINYHSMYGWTIVSQMPTNIDCIFPNSSLLPVWINHLWYVNHYPYKNDIPNSGKVNESNF